MVIRERIEPCTTMMMYNIHSTEIKRILLFPCKIEDVYVAIVPGEILLESQLVSTWQVAQRHYVVQASYPLIKGMSWQENT